MSSPLFLDHLVLTLVKGQKILDVGCGKGKWGFLTRMYKEPRLLVGIDLFLPFLKKAQYHRIYDGVICCSASALPFKANSFATVIASEVIEHMDKTSGEMLLTEAERVASQAVIMTTPNILRKRGGRYTSEGFNPHERHETRWTIGHLQNKGYKVRGAGFLPFAFFPLLNSLFSTVSFYIPVISTHLIAVKNLKLRARGRKVSHPHKIFCARDMFALAFGVNNCN